MLRIKLLFLLVLHQINTSAQKQLTVADFTTNNVFNQKNIASINWMNDGKYYTALHENRIVKFDITTGAVVESLVDGSALQTPLVINDYNISADERKILFQTNQESIYRRSYKSEYYVYDLISKKLQKLSAHGAQSYATFSPDGSMVAFVRMNNLFFVTLSDMKEVQVTDDGKFNHIINGSTDWVYEEEFSFVKGFFWSPDGSKLAYYRFDESDVKEYNLQKWNKGELYPEDYRFKYPKAGEKNSVVQIWIYDLKLKNKTQADLGTEKDTYIPRITWTKDRNLLSVRKLNRLQNNLQILHVDATSGKSNVVLEEKSPTYIDIEVLDDLTYLDDGKHFIFSSESDGFKHLYLYTVTGTLVRQMTKGNFEIVDFVGLDQRDKVLYYTSTENSSLGKQLFSQTLDGRKKILLTKESGTHSINMSNDFQYYIDQHSSAQHPVVASLYKTKQNQLIKVLEKNEPLVQTAKEYAIVPKEFFSFKTVDGSRVDAFMLKPHNFSETQKYPVVFYQYSGPGSQYATDSWEGKHFYFHQLLAKNGFVVVLIDTRGTGGKGESYKKSTYKELGKLELEDIVAAAGYMSTLPFVDAKRLAIWGWSYGGYMSSLAMTRSAGTFKLGIAVSPVTNWRFYDTVYTERYLQTPQLNPDGYDKNSPLTYAKDLQGKFLLIHGTGDDNVHVQNSMVFQDALISAGKQFDSFYYPDKNHSIPGAQTRHHLYSLMFEYIVNNL